MSLLLLLGLGFGLSVDTFAVAVGISAGIGRPSLRQILRLALGCGLFEGLTPIVGWAAGAGARGYIDSWSRWAAFGLLTAVGCKLVYAALDNRAGSAPAPGVDPTSGGPLVMISLGTSMDGLAAGLGLALVRAPILFPSCIIGLVTLVMTAIAMALGGRIGGAFGKRLEILGGIVLIAAGVKVLLAT